MPSLVEIGPTFLEMKMQKVTMEKQTNSTNSEKLTLVLAQVTYTIQEMMSIHSIICICLQFTVTKSSLQYLVS